MAVNTIGSIDVPLSLFGGLDTETAPSDLPEGVSPANNDVAYLPGSVASRERLHRILTLAISGKPAILYQKTYIQADGSPLTLLLDSTGKLWKEDVLNSPGTLTQVGSVVPGALAQSASAFDREYIAISDGVHGIDVPRQFDGTNFDRVSQDGPGAPPTVADLATTVAITSITPLAALNIASINQPSDSLEAGLTVVVTTTPHGLTVGDGFYLFVTNAAPNNGYSAIGGVRTVDSPTQFTYIAGFTGLGLVTATGTVRPATSTVVTATAHGLVAGDAFVVSGSPSNEYNNGSQYAQIDSGQNIDTNETWPVLKVLSATSFTLRTQSTPAAPAAGGTLAPGGFISVGIHKLVVMFLTRQGYITAPSPPVQWTSGGARQATVTNLPIGPSNVIARILAATGSGGNNYFWIPADVAGGARATIINDNTTTSCVLDFSDNSLFAATAIDIPGNNLFAQVVLGPCLGFFNYASRLFAWGEHNKVQNFLNMGFEGGVLSGAPTVPLGWDSSASVGGALVSNPAAFGDAWQITGNGTGAKRGMIAQPAFQDADNVEILSPATKYTFRCWAKAQVAGQSGTLSCDVISGVTVLASASINLTAISTSGGFVQADFSVAMPKPIPADALLRIYATSLANAQVVTVDEVEIVFTDNPYFKQFRVSYVNNPEAFDGVTGVLGPTADTSPLRCCSSLRNNLYINTAEGKHVTQDNATGEPSTWSVSEVSRQVGALSFRAGDPGMFGSGDTGEEWDLIAARGGLYIFSGGELFKISQEIQSLWDRINLAAQHRIWLKNDVIKRRAYIGVPLDAATTPNAVLVMDYRELSTAGHIASSPPVHISFTGKMIASDLTRKWTQWNVAAPCGEILMRPDNHVQMTFGGDSGQGNFFYLDETKLTDDGLNALPPTPSYTTYFFVNHEQEQQLQVGSHRKLFAYLAAFVTGVGNLSFTPLLDRVGNPWTATPQYVLSTLQDFDWEWGLNVVGGERVAFQLNVSPLSFAYPAYDPAHAYVSGNRVSFGGLNWEAVNGSTGVPPGTDVDYWQVTADVQFDVGKLIVTMRQDAITPIRGAL